MIKGSRNTGVKRTIASGKLKEERDEVDGHETSCTGCRWAGKEEKHSPRLKELYWHNLPGSRSTDSEGLLEPKQNEQHTGADGQSDDVPASPGPGQATERDSHDTG